VVEEKQRTGRAAVRWFLPESAAQLWSRRVILRAAALPVVNRVVGATLAGKPTAPITDLRVVGSSPTARPVIGVILRAPRWPTTTGWAGCSASGSSA